MNFNDNFTYVGFLHSQRNQDNLYGEVEIDDSFVSSLMVLNTYGDPNVYEESIDYNVIFHKSIVSNDFTPGTPEYTAFVTPIINWAEKFINTPGSETPGQEGGYENDGISNPIVVVEDTYKKVTFSYDAKIFIVYNEPLFFLKDQVGEEYYIYHDPENDGLPLEETHTFIQNLLTETNLNADYSYYQEYVYIAIDRTERFHVFYYNYDNSALDIEEYVKRYLIEQLGDLQAVKDTYPNLYLENMYLVPNVRVNGTIRVDDYMTSISDILSNSPISSELNTLLPTADILELRDSDYYYTAFPSLSDALGTFILGLEDDLLGDIPFPIEGDPSEHAINFLFCFYEILNYVLGNSSSIDVRVKELVTFSSVHYGNLGSNHFNDMPNLIFIFRTSRVHLPIFKSEFIGDNDVYTHLTNIQMPILNFSDGSSITLAETGDINSWQGGV